MVHLNEQVRNGLGYAANYILKILIVIAIASIAAFIYVRYILLFSIDLLPLVMKISEKMVTLLPLTALAFAVGYCPVGTRDRFHIRILLNVLAMIFLIFLIHDVSMGLNTTEFGEFGLEARDSNVFVDFSKLSYIFLILPVLGLIDSVLEYYEHLKSEETV